MHMKTMWHKRGRFCPLLCLKDKNDARALDQYSSLQFS